MTEVKLKNLTKQFGDLTAVDNVNLTFEEGEFTVLLGPSGCGKTTTLRCIAGLEQPTEGRILFNGEDVTDQSPTERNIAMVFQTYALYPHMTVYENIEFPLKLGGVDKEKRDTKVREMAEFLHIDPLLEKEPGQLSGGERQRTALGRAIVRDPAVFLLDEPLSNLDAKLRMQMRVELKRMHEELGITTVYVTHDQIEAMTMGTKIAASKDGRVQQVGTPKELFMKPQTTWVANFIGTPPMNTMEMSLEEDGNYVLEGSGFTVPISDDIGERIKKLDTTDKIILGVRPANFKVIEGGKAQGKGIEGEVHAVEPTGESVIVDVDIGGDIIKADVPNPTYRISRGKKVSLQIKEKVNVCCYDKDGDLIEGT